MGEAGVACLGHVAHVGQPVRHFVNPGSLLIARLPLLHRLRVVFGRRVRAGIVTPILQSQILPRRLSSAAGDSTGEGSSRRLGGLIRANIVDLDKERALDLAMAVAGEKVQVSPAAAGRAYEGAVVGETERYVVQRSGDEMVLHARRALLNTDLLVPGQVVNIRYPHGGAGLVEAEIPSKGLPVSEREVTRSRDRDLER